MTSYCRYIVTMALCHVVSEIFNVEKYQTDRHRATAKTALTHIVANTNIVANSKKKLRMVDSVPLKPKSMGFDIVSRANTVPRFKGFSFDRGACQGRTVSLGAGFLRLWFNVCVVFGSVVEVVSGKLNAHTGLRQRHFNQVIPNSKLS